MPLFIRAPLTLLGRVLLCAIFLMAAVGNKIPDFTGVASYMEQHHVPQPQLLLVGAILFLIAGSVSVILGYMARLGAILLLVFLVLASYYFHNFWDYDGQRQQQEMIQFLKNVAIMGAMVLIIANGPGPLSLDDRKK
jgi:putative oxidoreductase